VLTDPLGDQPWEQHRGAVTARAAEAPVLDTVLEPGDSLYLPRGYLHSATALGELSIHLTVGIHAISRYQLVRHLLAIAQEEPALRRSLPMGVDLGDPTVLDPHLRETVAALYAFLDGAATDAVAERVAADLTRQTRPAPISPLAQLAAADSLGMDTSLRMRAGLRVRLDRGETRLRLRLPDKAVTLPLGAESALKAVLTGEAFTPRELPGLDAAEQLDVARRLVREGMVVPVNAGD